MRRRARRDGPTFPALSPADAAEICLAQKNCSRDNTHTPELVPVTTLLREFPAATAARGCGAGIRLPGFSPASRAAGRQARAVGACISGASGCSLWPAPAAAMPPECSRCHACDQTTSARPTPPCEPAQLQPGSQRAAFSPRIRTRTHNTFITPRSTSPLDARPTTRRSPHAAFFRRTRRGRGAVWRV